MLKTVTMPLAFVFAFALFGAPNAPAAALLPTSGYAEAAESDGACPAPVAVYTISAFVAGAIAGGYLFELWRSFVEPGILRAGRGLVSAHCRKPPCIGMGQTPWY